ncbi:MAG: metallophosphoesterase [Balneolaceae bacterium]|nr:metallophosphoesterase [Balneolaceae bacterium]
MKISNSFLFSFWLLSLFILSSCSSSEPFYASPELEENLSQNTYQNADTLHTFILIGDTGDPKLDQPDPLISAMQHHLEESPGRSSAVFLGDNIYSSGMPADPQHEERKLTEDKISVALEALKNIDHPSYFIPGNHDWRYGQEGVIAQGEFIEAYPGIQAAMEPSHGCPGPFYTVFEDQWLLIALDSEWLVKQGQRAETDLSRCRFKTHDEVMSEVESIVANHPDKQLLVATHHPLYSNGSHGGYYTLKDHIFPLTNLESWMYLPMPILGTVYPVYRKIGNSSQDIPNKTYQRYKNDLLKATSEAKTRVFASGHEHSLAFFDKGDHFAIVSGSGSKKSPAKDGEGADFVYSEYGFSKLISFKNGDLAVEFWVLSDENPAGKRVFSKRISDREYNVDDEPDYDVSNDTSAIETRKIAPGPGYEAGAVKRAIWGDHYRDVWTTPVEMQAVNLNEYDILSIGGGQQSVSIVVEGFQRDPEYHAIYTERSIGGSAQDTSRNLCERHSPGSDFGGSSLRSAGGCSAGRCRRRVPDRT